MLTNTRTRKSSAGFTLVELMVVLAIISILAATVLFGLAGVQTTANNSRTKAQILRIHELMAERMESYETRRVSLLPLSAAPAVWFNDPTLRPLRRMIGMRELMRWRCLIVLVILIQ